MKINNNPYPPKHFVRKHRNKFVIGSVVLPINISAELKTLLQDHFDKQKVIDFQSQDQREVFYYTSNQEKKELIGTDFANLIDEWKWHPKTGRTATDADMNYLINKIKATGWMNVYAKFLKTNNGRLSNWLLFKAVHLSKDIFYDNRSVKKSTETNYRLAKNLFDFFIPFVDPSIKKQWLDIAKGIKVNRNITKENNQFQEHLSNAGVINKKAIKEEALFALLQNHLLDYSYGTKVSDDIRKLALEMEFNFKEIWYALGNPESLDDIMLTPNLINGMWRERVDNLFFPFVEWDRLLNYPNALVGHRYIVTSPIFTYDADQTEGIWSKYATNEGEHIWYDNINNIDHYLMDREMIKTRPSKLFSILNPKPLAEVIFLNKKSSLSKIGVLHKGALVIFRKHLAENGYNFTNIKVIASDNDKNFSDEDILVSNITGYNIFVRSQIKDKNEDPINNNILLTRVYKEMSHKINKKLKELEIPSNARKSEGAKIHAQLAEWNVPGFTQA